MKKLLLLLFVSWWQKYFNKNFVANYNSMEVHDLSREHKNCWIKKMSNKRYINKAESRKLLNGDFNGCRWCMPEYNNG